MGRDKIDVKKKMESLLTLFRCERQKQDCANTTETATELGYKSNWFAYKSMLFLLDKYAVKNTMNTEER